PAISRTRCDSLRDKNAHRPTWRSPRREPRGDSLYRAQHFLCGICEPIASPFFPSPIAYLGPVFLYDRWRILVPATPLLVVPSEARNLFLPGGPVKAQLMKTFTAALLTSFLILAFLSLVQPSTALDNGLALTPPMGWNSWNKFGCNVSEDLIKSMADGMVVSGMKDAAYQYVVIDDCWQVSRDQDGNIVPDAQRFPSGMKALGEYIHAKGLKFGIYSDAGEKTCAGRPGSMGHEYQDALMYAKWGVD